MIRRGGGSGGDWDVQIWTLWESVGNQGFGFEKLRKWKGLGLSVRVLAAMQGHGLLSLALVSGNSIEVIKSDISKYKPSCTLRS